jgi:hypothetical protein
MDRRHSGPWFYLAIALVVFIALSVTIAATTVDDCGRGVDKSWQVFPPKWKCEGHLPGYD